MDSLSRRYYEHQLGAGMGPELSFEKLYGYTEPVRRLIQREDFAPQANEIPNTMPSWLPGDDYLINFRKDHRQTRVFFRFPLFATFRIRYDSGPYVTIFNSTDNPEPCSKRPFQPFFMPGTCPILPGRIWLDCCSSPDPFPVFLPKLKTAPLEGGIYGGFYGS